MQDLLRFAVAGAERAVQLEVIHVIEEGASHRKQDVLKRETWVFSFSPWKVSKELPWIDWDIQIYENPVRAPVLPRGSAGIASGTWRFLGCFRIRRLFRRSTETFPSSAVPNSSRGDCSNAARKTIWKTDQDCVCFCFYLNIGALGVYQFEDDLAQFLRVRQLSRRRHQCLGCVADDAAGRTRFSSFNRWTAESCHLFGCLEQIFYLEGIRSGAHFDTRIAHRRHRIIRFGRVSILACL